MCPHAWASFQAYLPDSDPEDSRCTGIGELLATTLPQFGVEVTGTDLWRDSGFQVDCRIKGKPIYLYVVFFGEDPVQFVLCCTSNRGLFGWLKQRNDVPERWELARAVHRVLSGDSRIQNVRWYVETGWEARGDEPYVNEPPHPEISCNPPPGG